MLNREKELVMLTLFYLTWLYDDEDLESQDDNFFKGLTKKWREQFIPEFDRVHRGDCTGHPWSCIRCYLEDNLKLAERIIKAYEERL